MSDPKITQQFVQAALSLDYDAAQELFEHMDKNCCQDVFNKITHPTFPMSVQTYISVFDRAANKYKIIQLMYNHIAVPQNLQFLNPNKNAQDYSLYNLITPSTHVVLTSWLASKHFKEKFHLENQVSIVTGFLRKDYTSLMSSPLIIGKVFEPGLKDDETDVFLKIVSEWKAPVFFIGADWNEAVPVQTQCNDIKHVFGVNEEQAKEYFINLLGHEHEFVQRMHDFKALRDQQILNAAVEGQGMTQKKHKI